jgi:hypothetical protein
MLLGYTLLGFNLSLDVRDVRIWNNFTDSQANDNTTPDPDFGGHHGAILALWKGAIEWGSEPMGGSTWGSGGANFDPVYVGEATIAGTTTDCIISEKDEYGGNTLAFCYPGKNGWKIRFYARPWIWFDGPGNTPVGGSNMDLQGICAHEYGHAVGLDHSQYSNVTMYAYVSGAGNGQRTIENDDINGLKAIYGSKSSSKPHISSVSGGIKVGEVLTINGYNFSATGNEVWFTGDGSVGAPVKVTNIASSGGGTQVDVTIPVGAQAGTVVVKKSGTTHDCLSNNYPLEVGGSGANDPKPDIKIDGQDGPLQVPSTQAVRITVSMDPGDQVGVAHDWWVFGELNWSTTYWWKPGAGWKPSIYPIRAYDGGLFAASNYTVANGRLPNGFWTFTFAVDALDNNYQGTYIDTIDVQSY